MKKLRRKLNSENGAVMVIALLFFIVCMLVSAVIVSAAGMNASRIEKRYDEQKAYLAASSAAQLLRENLAGMTFKAEQENWKYTCGKSHADSGPHEWSLTESCATGVYINEFITNSAFGICKGGTADSYKAKYTLNVNEDKLSDVTTTVDVEMFANDTKKYDLECIIKSTTEGGSSYTMSLYINADDKLSSIDVEHENGDVHEGMRYGATWNGKAWVTYYDYTVTTTTLTVTWPEGTIQKGDAQ